jgi:hypothetical protein
MASTHALERCLLLALLSCLSIARPSIETVNNSIVIISPGLELRDPGNSTNPPVDIRAMANLVVSMQQVVTSLQTEVASLRQQVG